MDVADAIIADGVELSRTRWYECELVDLFRRQPRWEFFSWDKVDRTRSSIRALLFVWVKGQQTPRCAVLTGEVNFQPGYALFAAAIQQSDAAAASKGRMSVGEFKARNRAENLAFKFTWNAADQSPGSGIGIASRPRVAETGWCGLRAHRDRLGPLPAPAAAGFAIKLRLPNSYCSWERLRSGHVSSPLCCTWGCVERAAADFEEIGAATNLRRLASRSIPWTNSNSCWDHQGTRASRRGKAWRLRCPGSKSRESSPRPGTFSVHRRNQARARIHRHDDPSASIRQPEQSQATLERIEEWHAQALARGA